MELFSKSFPVDCNVVVRLVGDELRVVVHSQRPNPVWLEKHRAGRKMETSDQQIEEQLFALVMAEPGLGPTYYTRLSPDVGGIRASQERKEAVLGRMIEAGRLVCSQLDKQVGRRKVGVFPVEGLPSAMQGV